MTEDRNFDDIAHKFAKNIYGSDKGEIRQIIVWEDFLQILSELDASQQPLEVLDAGGGLAQMSQKLAKLGHRVALCDLSSEMLQLAKQDIEKNGLLEQYRLIHSPVQSIAEHMEEQVDLVMFHAVMEWLVDPKTGLETVLEQVKPGGIASVMFYNHHGLVYKNVVCGNIPHILDGMPHRKRFKLQPQKGLKPEDVYQWIEEAGFSICGKSGIRSFSDYIGNMQYMGDYEFEDVLALEKQLCRQEPYLSLGRYIHVWAKKNDKQE
ncbi:tRNA uridine 5-oxyacetic acid(34) methyltransferase CmoM [Vibrio parahaemolyticus]|uniref:tRNA uridine 5-oxyacetic acid(34) methyltransferase CmoM n=1 Tax=Vibrio parahaemolyticus TaxID=670 RepID=UPI00084B47B7|nr:tRNA uridine 5-oxyacetic acid(34) methyltransferase CmoM [Vibrio parahaemolyticus]EJG0633076.1 tRNA uridine 5-oxyacetic acid(34) methyltransferase CmoM [Vibrio parahaemolyticus]EJG0736151.1 tRNA uridine 5-oxyacetic acid(34) methyltransferase CmoM [Vibrio parahaemolyticus]EJG0915145.1 tRNA uridine 5-oxyacetic acid(34) methyltransferase CmoM [Vibrio parahaemolyticus]EJG1030083.1 tRNA uridine 5-oxyacetic acid(34) methyltransferase CmoM [Vibrio parahaemolyticus]EJP3283601.1 tRNA uridine 5-oxyac